MIALETGGIFTDGMQEVASYTDANSSTVTSVTAIIILGQDGQGLDDTWETRTRIADAYIEADDLAGITYTPREDTITSAAGMVYTVLDRYEIDSEVFRYALERADFDAVALRARRY